MRNYGICSFDTLVYSSDADENVKVSVSCYVRKMKDPYGTGDSPTMYEVDDVTIEDNFGDSVSLDSMEYNKVVQEAINRFANGEW